MHGAIEQHDEDKHSIRLTLVYSIAVARNQYTQYLIKKKIIRPNARVHDVVPSVTSFSFFFWDESTLQGFINKICNENMMHEV